MAPVAQAAWLSMPCNPSMQDVQASSLQGSGEASGAYHAAVLFFFSSGDSPRRKHAYSCLLMHMMSGKLFI